jgi:hypothetical protein
MERATSQSTVSNRLKLSFPLINELKLLKFLIYSRINITKISLKYVNFSTKYDFN